MNELRNGALTEKLSLVFCAAMAAIIPIATVLAVIEAL